MLLKQKNILTPYKEVSYDTLKQIYSDNFSMSCFNTDCQNKMALIFLVCYLTDKAKAKKPDTNCWKILYALNKDIFVPDSVLIGLSIICDDFFRAGGDFPTFGLKQNEIIPKVKEILKTYLPF